MSFLILYEQGNKSLCMLLLSKGAEVLDRYNILYKFEAGLFCVLPLLSDFFISWRATDIIACSAADS